jgi:NifB/MoaA-like Fe-S oxidoreductase
MLERLERDAIDHRNSTCGTILTGTLFAPVLRPMIKELNTRFATRIHVEAVRNDYFGGDVSVAGLLTGGDLISARTQVRGNFVVIPKQMLKSDEDILLDGMRLEELRSEFGLPVHPVDTDSLFRLLIEQN